MTIKNFATIAGLAAGAAATMTLAAPANAASLDFTGGGSALNTCNGQVSCSVNGFTLTAQPEDEATLAKKTVNGVGGLGVNFSPGGSNGGGSQKEIDAYEMLNISFKEAVVKTLDLVFLYEAGNHQTHFGDIENETAKVEAGGKVGFLTVIDELTASWVFDGGTPQIINALSPADGTGGGWFSIANPFGDLAVSSIDLLAELKIPEPLFAQTGIYSDYSLGGISTAAVPEPATLLGLGVLALGTVAGLRKKGTEA